MEFPIYLIIFTLDWVDQNLGKAYNFLQNSKNDEFKKALVNIRILRREGKLDLANQEINILKTRLDPDKDREIYQVLLIEEQSVLFDRGMLLEMEEISDGIITEAFNHPISGNEYIIGTRFLMLGIIISKAGNQISAIYQFLHSAKIFEQTNLSSKNRIIALAYNNTGYSYSLLGEINEAIKYYELSIDTNSQNNPYDTARTFANLGLAYSYIPDYDKALENLRDALEIVEILNNPVAKSLPLFNLVYVYSQMGNLREANRTLQQLTQLKEYCEDMVVYNRIRMAKAIYKFYQPTFEDKANSYNLFCELIEDRFLIPLYKKLAYSYQAEILLQEMAIFDSKHRMNEIKKIINKINQLADTEQSSSLKINALILNIQVLLLSGRFNEAQELRNEVHEISQKHNIISNTLQLQYYLNYLFQAKWGIDQSFGEKINDLNIIQIIKSIRTDRIQIPITTEIPVMFLLIGPNGTVQDQIIYTENLEGNQYLIASFIQAINTFFMDTLKDNESIEQINSKEYSIVIRSYETGNLVYIFKGIALNVPKKMMRIALKLQEIDFGSQFVHDPQSLLQVRFTDEIREIINEEIFRDVVEN